MTIGEKIRYCRQRLHITQDMLAKLTGIHPVSIRKYETNKMQPQPAQLERLAAALGVSYNALNGVDHVNLRMETIGDLMGVLMVLFNSDILRISGERDKENMLIADTVEISFNPLLAPYFSVKAENGEADLENVLIRVKNKSVLQNLLIWEKMNYICKKSEEAAAREPSKAADKAVQEIIETKEKIELHLQKDQIMLDRSEGLMVKIPPDYSNSPCKQ